MGQFKRKYYDDTENKIYDLDTHELVCAHHISDDFIQNYILTNGRIGKCDYCEQRRKIIELHEVLKLIITAIDCVFEDANDTRNHNPDGEHGFDGQTKDFYDIYYDDDLDIGIQDDKLLDDIYNYLKNDQIIYGRRDEFGDEADYLKGLWNYFKEVVKHKARFVFHYEKTFSDYSYRNPAAILYSVQSNISKLKLFRKISINERLYRCVQHHKHDEVKGDGKRIAANPDSNCKKNNRMSPAGISMFYCSPSEELCIKETVDFAGHENPYYTTAFFTSPKELNLVDFTKLPEMPSIFDADHNMHIETLYFLKDFIEDITKPIQGGDRIIDYIPTQIVTEYIRYNPGLKVEGIIYPSSVDSDYENIVLFMDHEMSLEQLQFHYESIATRHI